MPELAEVHYYASRWAPAVGKPIQLVDIRSTSRVFRDMDARTLGAALTGSRLRDWQTHGKQMLFGFTRGHWLWLHLGMTGRLFIEGRHYIPTRHDALVIRTANYSLVFSDPRMFGRLYLEQHPGIPESWRALPPQILDDGFSRDSVNAFLERRARSPIKAVLLMQEQFPGVGNWMADEILWRAGIHPARTPGELTAGRRRRLFDATIEVAREAMEVIAPDFADPPDTWLFNHRWREGGLCPKTGKPLRRETIGGRTTCYSPARQR